MDMVLLNIGDVVVMWWWCWKVMVKILLQIGWRLLRWTLKHSQPFYVFKELPYSRRRAVRSLVNTLPPPDLADL